MKLKLALAMISVMFVPAMTAEVVDSASNGFTIRITLTIKAAPDAIYRQILKTTSRREPLRQRRKPLPSHNTNQSR